MATNERFSWRPRFFRAGDEAALLDLLSETFGSWPAVELTVPPMEHLQWKLRSHPCVYPLHIVAEAGSQLIGSRVFIARRVKVGDATLLQLQGLDNAVRPGFQRHGVMSRLRTFAVDELCRTFDLKLGGHSGAAGIQRLRGRFGELEFGNGPVALRWRSTAGRQPAGSRPEVTFTPVTTLDGRFDTLWRDACLQFDFAGVRDATYLNWRYADPRAGSYVIGCVEERDGLTGYAVLRASSGRGYVADILALPGRLDAVRSLVAGATAWFARHRVRRADCWIASRHAYRPVLEDLGFASKQGQLGYSYLPMRAENRALTVLADRNASVHLTLGDWDLV